MEISRVVITTGYPPNRNPPRRGGGLQAPDEFR